MDKRTLEKEKKYGYLIYIEYDGRKFDSFDENSGKKSVKGDFITIMNAIGISWAKGVQQAGRTDANVSAKENILYISSYFNGNRAKLIEKFNKKSRDLKIIRIEKSYPNLVLPNMIEAREYHYSYPKDKIKRSEDEIKRVCEELSGEYDVSEFTDKKGENLKQKIRKVEISYKDGTLIFIGESFMPKQVRIMSAYIFSGEKKIFPAKYLTLNKIYLNKELKESIFYEVDDIDEELVTSVEKNSKYRLFYVEKRVRSEFIGKNGKNIKRLQKIYGDIVVKDVWKG